MPSPSIVGTPTQGSGSASSFTITPPSGLAATDRVYVVMVHASNTQLGFDAVPGEPEAKASLVDSAFGGGMTLRLLQIDTNDGVTRSGKFFSGSPNNLVSSTFAWVAFGMARDAGSPSIPISRNVSTGTGTSSTTGPVTTPTITPTVNDALVIDVVGWSRATTMTGPEGSTELGEARSGNEASDRSIWASFRTVAGGANTALPGISVTNDNPYGYTAAAFAVWTIAFVIDAPPGTWQINVAGGLPGNLQIYIAADRDANPGFGPIPRLDVRTADPPPGCSHYVRMRCHDDDVAPLTATENPRAQMVSPRYMFPGDTRYMDWWTRFPADFPDIPYEDGKYLMFAQLHGPLFLASPTVAFYVRGQSMDLRVRDFGGLNPSTVSNPVTVSAWKHPIVRERWLHFCWRIRMVNNTTGFVDFWFNGRKQRLGNGLSTRVNSRTANVTTTQLELHCNSYRTKGAIPGVVTLDHAGMRIGVNPPPEIDMAPPVVSAGRPV